MKDMLNKTFCTETAFRCLCPAFLQSLTMTQLSLVHWDDILHMYVSLHFSQFPTQNKKFKSYHIFRGIQLCVMFLECFYSKIYKGYNASKQTGILTRSVVITVVTLRLWLCSNFQRFSMILLRQQRAQQLCSEVVTDAQSWEIPVAATDIGHLHSKRAPNDD